MLNSRDIRKVVTMVTDTIVTVVAETVGDSGHGEAVPAFQPSLHPFYSPFLFSLSPSVSSYIHKTSTPLNRHRHVP